METVIQFRSVIESFNNDEFNSFTKKLFDVYDKRELLIKSLFFMLLNESKRNKDDDILQINTICKSITDLRKKSKSKSKRKCIERANKKNKSKQNYFNVLPTVIISQTASYLKTSEQPQFMRCNRYIFISCSSTPSTIRNLTASTWFDKYVENHGPQFRHYQILKTPRFRMAKQVTINASNPFLPFVSGWKTLNILHIEPLKLNIYQSLIKYLKKIEIKQLRFDALRFSENDEKIDSEKQTLLNFLSTNKSVQFIDIGFIGGFEQRNFDISFDSNLLKQRFNHLKGFGFNIGSAITLRDQMLSGLSQQIESLHIRRIVRRAMALSSDNDIYYTNLKELCMIRIDYMLISNILRTAVKLKRIYWKFATGNIRRIEMNEEHRQIVLKHILSQLIELQYLEIVTSFNERIFESIKQGFKDCITKRKNIKLKITLRGTLNQNALGFIEENIEEMVDTIQRSVTQDFLFSLIIIVNNNDEYKGIRNKLTNMSSIINNKYSIQQQSFTITKKNNDTKKRKLIHIINKNNSMNGYHQQWMFQCQQCSH